MSFFSVLIGRDGPILKSFIGISLRNHNAFLAANKQIPSVINVNLLIDTGATNTVICMSKLKQLNTAPINRTNIHTPSTGCSPVSKDIYDINLLLPSTHFNSSHFHFLPGIEVIESDFSMQNIDGLLGRDVLAHAHMTYSGRDGVLLLSIESLPPV